MAEEVLYRIIRIDEDDYGCEARPDDYVPMVLVTIGVIEENDFGQQEEIIRMEDSLLYARNIDEGDMVVIGSDGTLFPPEMLCNEPTDADFAFERSCMKQAEWMDNYMDAIEEMEDEE